MSAGAFDPDAAIAALGVKLVEVEGQEPAGLYDDDNRVISIRAGLNHGRRRSVLGHEYVKARRRDIHPRSLSDDVLMEREVDEAAARMLISLDDLAHALAAGATQQEVASLLWVDVRTLRVRIRTLTPCEDAYLDKTVGLS